jgi:hypothetical protein
MAEVFAVNSIAGPQKIYNESRALVIGLSDYENKLDWVPLPSVPTEVKNVGDALRMNGFDVETTLNLSSSEIQDKLKSFLFQNTDRDTRIVVYFAGHGWTDGQSTGYIVPTDAPGEGKDGFLAKLVSMQQIMDWSYSSRAKHILFIFDSCFSGAVFLTRSNLKPSELVLRDADRVVRQFITSGSATDAVPALSDFAPKFIDGLRGAADIYRDGVVTGNELGYWLKNEIAALGKQTPQFGSSPLTKFRFGDMLFRPLADIESAIAVEDQKPIKLVAAGTNLGRGASVRSLGEPASQKAGVFNGLEVFYYEKLADGSRIRDALDKREIPYVRTRASLPDKFEANAIACGPDIPIDSLKALALALIEDGVPIRAIFRFRDPAVKPKRLEVVSLTKDAAGSELLATPPLTVEQIAQLQNCPSNLRGESS